MLLRLSKSGRVLAAGDISLGPFFYFCAIGLMMMMYFRRRPPKAKVVKWFWEILAEATHEYRIQVFQWCVLYSSDDRA